MWNSVGEFLTRGAQGLPLLLVLEDLHWADESTVLLTEYLAPLLPDLPVLLLGTYRDGEVDVSHPLARVISVLARRRLVDRIGLRGLSPGGVRAMVEALAAQPVPDQLVRLVETETEGNPFFIEEVYLHLEESGVLLDEHGRVRQDLSMAEDSVPEGVRLVLGRRLERLSPTTRDALTAAAVLGRVFSPDLVGEVAPADPDALVDAFDEAEHARLIVPAPRYGHLAFSHELIRQTLLADASTLKRERLHLRAADTIERRYADDMESHAGDLTHHLSLAGSYADPARLVRHLGVAGRRAFDAAAFDEAVVQFEKALALVAPGDQEARSELLERLALALRSVRSLGRLPPHDERGARSVPGTRLDRRDRPAGVGDGVPADLERPGSGGCPDRPAGPRRSRRRRHRGPGPADQLRGLGAEHRRGLRERDDVVPGGPRARRAGR